MVYQLVNKRTEILAVATSHIAHLCKKYNHVFALLICMPRFNSVNFHQNWSKIKLVLPKGFKIFERSVLRPQTPKQLPVTDFWLRSWSFKLVVMLKFLLHTFQLGCEENNFKFLT